MIEVLGFELSHAVAVLEKAGYCVQTEEISSRKGLKGNERRVVRVKSLTTTAGGQSQVCLTYAVFCTQVAE